MRIMATLENRGSGNLCAVLNRTEDSCHSQGM